MTPEYKQRFSKRSLGHGIRAGEKHGDVFEQRHKTIYPVLVLVLTPQISA